MVPAWVTGFLALAGFVALVFGIIAPVQQFMQHGWSNFLRAAAVSVGGLLLLAVVCILIYGDGTSFQTLPAPRPVARSGEPIAAEPGRVSSMPSSELPSTLLPQTRKPTPTPIAPSTPSPSLRPQPHQAKPSGSASIKPRTPPSSQPPALLPVQPPQARQPKPLPKSQSVFKPSEVVFCPFCKKAFSAHGPRDDVACPNCKKEHINLVSWTVTVVRCRNCGEPFTAPANVRPLLGPYLMTCPRCGERQKVPQ